MSELESTVQVDEDMKVCNQCGAKVKADAQFCSACGRPMNIAATKKFCARCGTELTDEEMFCHNCGSPTSQSRDVEVMNNIAAYNNSIGKPKKTACIVNIKDNSVFSFITWILTAVFTGLLTAGLTSEIAYAVNFNAMITAEMIFFVLGLLGFAVTTISGILFWKNDKKLRLMPVIASLIATVCCTISFEPKLMCIELLVAALVMHVVAILFAVKVIKTRVWLLTTSIIAIIFTLALPIVIGSNNVLPFILSLPMFLLSFSFTKKELKEIPKKKQMLRRLIALLLSVLLLFGGIGFGLYESWVYVGDISNMNIDKAKDKYSRLDVQTTYEYSESVEKDCVIKQSVEKGSFIHPNKKITLTVSKGAGVKVPEVANLTLSDAKKKLEDLGLKVSTTYDYSSSIAKDKVIRASGSHVDEGATVTLTVSKGPDTRVNVPDVEYLTESEARKKLQNAGFKVNVEYVYQTCDAYKNTSSVKSQSLTGKQNPGSTVTIRVAKPSISITQVNFEHNSVGGVDINISFKNLSNKTIKYVTFTTRFKNSVGDNVYCDIRRTSTMDLEYTGPLYSGRSDRAYWDAVIYAWTCKQIHFDEIEVTFMDGTTHSMTYNGYWY